MLHYVVRRAGLGAVTVITVTVVLFAILHAMPGDPIRMFADPRMPEHQIQALQARWGLDRPLHVQYLIWLRNMLSGEMGTSIATRRPVSELVLSRLPYTLYLAGGALLIRYVAGVTLGLLVPARRGSWLDRLLLVLTVGLRSVPSYWLGILAMLLVAVKWRVLPISGYSGPASLILPVLSLALPTVADTMQLTRTEVLEVLREQFVTTAKAKGLPHSRVLIKHVLRNAVIPVTVTFFLSLPWVLGGSVVVETVFAWPGMGRLLWNSILNQDLPVVQAIIFIIALLTVLSNLVGDLLCAWLDPRIRYGYEAG